MYTILCFLLVFLYMKTVSIKLNLIGFLRDFARSLLFVYVYKHPEYHFYLLCCNLYITSGERQF